MKKLKILNGNTNSQLTDTICNILNVKKIETITKNFMDGEYYIRIKETVRGFDVFVIHPISKPVNDNLMKLLITIDALKRASANTINIVMPYYGYTRQEKITHGREPITAKLVANLIETSGANRVITMDLHKLAIQGFFNIPLDHISAIPLISKHFLKMKIKDAIVVSPDIGGTIRARNLAKLLKTDLAIIDKRRPKQNESEVMNIIGDVKNKTAILIDDIIDTGGSIVKAAEALKRNGAKQVYAACSHAVFSGNALSKIDNSPIEKLIITDSIFHEKLLSKKIEIISIAPLLATIIKKIHLKESISDLF